jgi:hypothetical protein
MKKRLRAHSTPNGCSRRPRAIANTYRTVRSHF